MEVKHYTYLLTPELNTTRIKKLLRFLKLIPKREEIRLALYCDYEGGYINLWQGWGFGPDMKVLEYITVYKDGSSNRFKFD